MRASITAEMPSTPSRAFVVVVAMLANLFVGGCASERCSFDYRFHGFEVTRDVVTSSPVEALVVEACLGSSCMSASPAANGKVLLAGSMPGPSGGSVGPTEEPAKKRVSMSYSVGEGSSELLVLRVKSGDAMLLDEKVAIRWTDEDCHPEPLSTKL